MLNSFPSERFSSKDLLLPWRKKFWDRFVSNGSLDPSLEAFRYADLKRISWPDFAKGPEEVADVGSGYRIVLIDGFFSEKHSFLPSGVIVKSLEEAFQQFPVFLQNRWQRLIEEEKDPLACLNGALSGRGAFCHIPAGMQIETPIFVHHIITKPLVVSPRLSIYVGKQASCSLVEEGQGIEERFCNLATEALIEEAGSLTYRIRSVSGKKGVWFSHFKASLKREALLNYHLYSEGSRLARHAIHVQLLEPECRAILKGLTDLKDENQSHVHAWVEHRAPRAFSRQHFKAVVRDAARSTFEGKIYVQREAQKTEAYQLCQSLLLSDRASCFAKPNLQIFADDVKASHGATVSQPNQEEIFYLRSRGLSLAQAQQSLLEGFIEELKECKELP